MRLTTALLASLLAHLALLGNLANFRWPAAPPDDGPVLHARLSAEPAKQRLAAATERAELPPAMPPRAQPQRAMESAPPPFDEIPRVEPAPMLAEEVPAAAVEAPPVATEANNESPLRGLPPGGTLVYRFYWGKSRWLAGQAIHQWFVDHQSYVLSSQVTTTGLFGLLHPVRLVETSQGMVVGGRLRPQMFITQLDDHPPAIGYFNWEKAYYRWYRRDAQTFTQPLPANAYDKISFLYQLYIDTSRDAFPSPHITTGRRLEAYDIRNLGVEEVDIDGSPHAAIHLTRVRPSADLEQIDIWLSLRDKLPVKMSYANQAGDYFEQLITADSLAASSSQR